MNLKTALIALCLLPAILMAQVPAANTIRIPQSNGSKFVNKDTVPAATGFMGISAGLAPTALTTAQSVTQLGLLGGAFVNTSTGGNGVADAGKAVLFGASGNITVQPSITVEALIGSNTTTLSSSGFTFSNGTNSTALGVAVTGADVSITIPAVNGSLVSTGDTGTVSDTMLAGSIAPSKITGTAAVLTGNAFDGANTITLDALGTTPTPALSLINTTAAAAGAQQVSPSLIWSGRGWKTDATAESRTVAFKSYLLPVQGTANPSANLVFGSEINGAAFTESFRIYSQGSTYAASMSSNAGTTYFTVGGGGALHTSASIFATLGNIGPLSDSGLLFIGTNQQVLFAREAAYTFGIRNGTNPMAIRLFETDNGANDEYLEISAAAGTNTIKPTKSGTGTASKLDIYPTETVRITSGTGSPESAVTAEVGSLYLRTDGGASTTLYVKESGSGDTGWVAK